MRMLQSHYKTDFQYILTFDAEKLWLNVKKVRSEAR